LLSAKSNKFLLLKTIPERHLQPKGQRLAIRNKPLVNILAVIKGTYKKCLWNILLKEKLLF